MPPWRDDETIGDDAWLWRRIRDDWMFQEEDGHWRPESAAFVDDTDGYHDVSLHLPELLSGPEQVVAIAGRPQDSVAAVRAGDLRALGYLLVRDPTRADPSHVLMCVPPGKSNARRVKDAKRIVRQIQWAYLNPPQRRR